MKIALLAGYGKLPVFAVRSLQEANKEFIVVTFSEEFNQSIETNGIVVYSLSVGQVGKILDVLKKESVTDVIFAGKVNKSLLYNNLKLDMKAVKILFSLKDRKDDTIMNAVIDELSKMGINVLKQTDVLKSLLAEENIIIGKSPTNKEKEDIEFGFKIAKELGRLDIGQTVVVKNKAVMALEAIEGTDAAIERGLQLAKKGGIVVKVAKPDQDERFDVPTVGVDTLKKIADNKGRLLAVEAGKTFIVDKKECENFAKKNGITLISVQGA
ncbi:UDP-2,3-diacylglucosamine diphosphatase LpxI [Deferribacteraceae bacterium V6Fe1]|nr:UDP-2,3-diacylglucosamine diphosphatase LpxI [Deferribacteraceae bacterium V6Fe1]